MEIQKLKVSEIKLNPNNPRLIKDDKFTKLVQSIKDFPEMLDIRPIVVNSDMVILGGNMRFKACKEAGLKEVPIIIADNLTEEQQREFLIKDNTSGGEWDFEMLANEWDVEQLEEWGLDIPNFEADENEDKVVEAHAKLTDTFIVPPFTILDSRQGYWNERKSYWKQLINDNGESREDTLAKGSMMSALNNGVSILDPVLSELVNLWFGLPNSKTFDCFAGDSVFGYVSSYLGNSFTGIELRKEQADLNNERIKGFKSKYICDDGRNVLNHIKENSQDLLFSCPPYFDLEVYSDLENDASNQDSYEEFIEILDTAFTNAIKCLKDNRFAVVIVGDVRDKQGFYYRFVDDIKDIFKRNNILLYNELILVESIGTLPQRVGKFMEHRKIGKCHQNVLVFYKGNPKEIKNIYPKLKTIEYESTDV
jgi:DNA modification methylase